MVVEVVVKWCGGDKNDDEKMVKQVVAVSSVVVTKAVTARGVCLSVSASGELCQAYFPVEHSFRVTQF